MVSAFCDGATLVGFGGTGGGETKPFGSSGRVVRKGLSNGVEGGSDGFAPALLLLSKRLGSSDRVEPSVLSGLARSGDGSTCAVVVDLVAIFKLA